MRLLLIDHQDSYSRLLHQMLWKETGREPLFLAATEALASIQDGDWDAAILSPGPGHPAREEDFGPTADFLRAHAHKPILGVCLGHQGMASVAGARVLSLPHPQHGKISRIRHQGQGLFAGLPGDFPATRYHSLQVHPMGLPGNLSITAHAVEDQCIMGLSFTDRPWHGVQFHPESIGTPQGPDLLRNFLRLATASGPVPIPTSIPVPPVPLRPAPPDLPAPKAPGLGIPKVTGAFWLGQTSYTRRFAGFPKAETGRAGAVAPKPSPTLAHGLFRALFAAEKLAFWLDPSPAASPSGWETQRMGSATHWLEVTASGLSLNRYSPSGETGSDAETVTVEEFAGHPADILESLRGLAGKNPAWVGWLHYEFGALCADAPQRPRPSSSPFSSPASPQRLDASESWGTWLLPERELAWDAATQSWLALCLAENTGQAEAWFAEVEKAVVAAWDSAEATETIETLEATEATKAMEAMASFKTPGQAPGSGDQGPWKSSLSRWDYAGAFAAIQRALRQGDSYEACLTLTATRPSATEPLAVYLALRQLNPSPFGAYLRRGDLAILCASPELFLQGDGQGGLKSRPIKGTRRRGGTPEADAARRDELAQSPKDKAEHLMITDLVRNDLGRVCRPGSVQVTSFQALEAHSRVWQMVSEVRGRLREGLGFAASLKAAFPGGSMTGAPKPRTMAMLRDLEKRPRGIYSGALGTFGSSRDFTLAMVIRTLVRQGGHYAVGCGGAIVVDSEEESEWREAWLKAEVLQQALSLKEDMPHAQP